MLSDWVSYNAGVYSVVFHMDTKKQKIKLNTIDKILIADVMILLLFTIAMIIVFCIYQAIPDTLVECFFGCAGGEGIVTFFLWWIKKRYSQEKKK